MNKGLFLLSLIVAVSGCSNEKQTIPLYQVTSSEFNVVLPAKGELEAAEAEVISSPGRTPMTIAWLAEEYISVKKGQVVAQFDSEKLELDARKEQLAMALLDKDMRQKLAQKNQQQEAVENDKVLITKEFAFVDSFAVDDIRVYSKLEIIDTLQNKEFLGAKDNFLDWKIGSVTEQNDSAVGVLEIKQNGHQAKLKQHQDALVRLEVKAPFDGLLVYEKNWRGEKPAIGQTVFPGATIGKIPNLKKMQAKIYVLDKEAIGIASGQSVNIVLDAFPDKKFTGTVSDVAGFSRTIQRGNPTKYFEVKVGLNDSASQLLQPGRKLSAEIEVASESNKLLIPLQAIFNEDGKSWVYKHSISGFKKQLVETGNKNLHFVEVTQGLEDGDQIALATPEENNNV